MAGSWGVRISWAAFALAVLAVGGALLAAVGAGQDWWDKLAGLAVLRYAFFAAIFAVALALTAAAIHFRKRSARPLLIVAAAVIAGGYLAYIGQQIRIARSVPAIHDITTDLSNPPAFETLTLRPDNFAVVPEDQWRKLHAEAYADVKPLRLDVPVSQAVTLAESAARARGWEIAAVEPDAGRLEATDAVSLFGFKDDVVVRVRPEGAGSVVDVRSVSRIGVSDLGVNARRVRDLLADIERAAGAKAG